MPDCVVLGDPDDLAYRLVGDLLEKRQSVVRVPVPRPAGFDDDVLRQEANRGLAELMASLAAPAKHVVLIPPVPVPDLADHDPWLACSWTLSLWSTVVARLVAAEDADRSLHFCLARVGFEPAADALEASATHAGFLALARHAAKESTASPVSVFELDVDGVSGALSADDSAAELADALHLLLKLARTPSLHLRLVQIGDRPLASLI